MGFVTAGLFGAASAGFSAGPATGIPDKYHGLVSREPFMPKAGPPQPSAKPEVAGSYRFTGFVIFDENIRAGVENVSQNKSYLMAAGQTEDGITLKEINPKEKRIILVVGGEAFRLDLTEPAVNAPAMTPQVGPPPPLLMEGINPSAPLRRRIIVPFRR